RAHALAPRRAAAGRRIAAGAHVKLTDVLGLAFEALHGHRLRYALTALAVAVGIGAVVMLSSIGEGTRRFIIGQMTQFGTTIIAVYPGRTQTGGMPGIISGSMRKLSLDDARALTHVAGVTGVVPTVYGTAVYEYRNRSRATFLFGATSQGTRVWSMHVASGQFLPEMDFERGSPVVVLGPRVKTELFGQDNALGATIRIGQTRFRVIGVMESKGQMLGFDLDDAAYVPVASAMRLLNRPEIDELDVLASSPADIDAVSERMRQALFLRHDHREDFTIMTQKEGQEMVNNVLNIVTAVVTGIAAISLLVGAIGILTIMWIVVQERVAEIGLVKALGATRRQILTWYLIEAGLTSLAGGAAGLLVGATGAWILRTAVPGLESFTSPTTVALALVVSLAAGLLAGIAPALRAARLDPIEALRGD
ncbi:MAG TPA: ABC transporter permease, partial [Dongiaceae bacterium]|nr:ABC transporter permease [Dongiaceae bacterium]